MWLLPVVFMIHDFEEIIMMRPFIEKNREFLTRRFPDISARMLPHFEGLSTSSFALAVAVMFLIVSTTTLIAMEFDLYALWAGALIGFFIHLIVHIGQFLVARRYVPVVITSVVAAPYCIWALITVNARHPLPQVRTLIWSVVAFVVIAVMVVLAHGLAARFERLLTKYRAG